VQDDCANQDLVLAGTCCDGAKHCPRAPIQVQDALVTARKGVAMVTKGLLVRLEAQHGRERDLEDFLRSAQGLVAQEPATTAWFALRFGRLEYGIFDVFPDEAGRQAHLAGAVAAQLFGPARQLLARDPQIQRLSLLAHKLPAGEAGLPVTRGLLLTFKAKQGHEAQVESFLRDAQGLVEREPGTTAWFALHLEQGEYGIFDVFPDNMARLSHLSGHVPRELAKHALSLLGGLPDMDMLHVLATRFAPTTP
jgi:quinol monooxygenase YgiN